LPCQYPESEGQHLSVPPTVTRSTASTATSTASSVLGPASPYSLEGDIDALDSENFQRRLLELQLLHHYVTVVGRTMPASKIDVKLNIDVRELYVVDTVQLAFEYPFLLNTIFAISALHKTQPQPKTVPESVEVPVEAIVMAQERGYSPAARFPAAAAVSPETSNGASGTTTKALEYERAHRLYLSMSIRQQREALMDLGPKNADAVCLNSVLLSIIALKLLPDKHEQKYEPPVQWLSMAQAISTCVQASQPFLSPNSAMRRIMALIDPDFRDREAMFNPSLIEPFKAILDYPDTPTPTEEESRTYNLAAAYVGGIYRAIQNQDPHRQIARRIMSLGPMLPKQFIGFVVERRPRALVLIACVMSMTRYIDDYWFFRGTAEHEVYGIQGILPDEWQHFMQWPIEMLKTLEEPQYRNHQA
jgi:hypothetical protein